MCVCDGKELRVHVVAEELQKGDSFQEDYLGNSELGRFRKIYGGCQNGSDLNGERVDGSQMGGKLIGHTREKIRREGRIQDDSELVWVTGVLVSLMESSEVRIGVCCERKIRGLIQI